MGKVLWLSVCCSRGAGARLVGQGKSSRRPTCLFPLGGQRMAAVWTVGVVRGWVGGWVGLGFGELPRHAPLGPPCRASPDDQVVGTGSRPSSGRQLMHLAETTFLVVTARVPVLVGSERRLASAFHLFFFCFLKRPSTFSYAGAQPPPDVPAAVGEHLHVPRGVQFTP